MKQRLFAILLIFCALVLYFVYTKLTSTAISGSRRMRVQIPAFSNGSRIPQIYTCDGEDINPEIVITDVPEEARSLAIVVYDPDAPLGIFYHWLLYDIPVNGSTVVVPEALPKSFETAYGYQGINDFGRIGYNGPCPPRGHGVHRYYFLVVALDTRLPPQRIKARDFLELVKGHVIAEAEYMGTYSRS